MSENHDAAHAVLHSLPVGLYVVDRDLRIVAWNAERERGPFGRPAAEVLGRPLSEVLPRAGYESLLPRLRRIFESGEAIDEIAESPQEGKVRAFRVRRRPVFRDGIVTHVLSLFEDVSAEQERERFLRTLDKAVKTMQLGVTVTDVEGNILYTNPADARMHGWTPDELIGQHASVYAPSGRRRTLLPAQLAAMKSWRRESVNVTRDGRLFPVQLLSDVVTDLHDSPVGLVTTCEDITERRRAAEQIENLAYRDTLTGLPNRRLFTDRLDVAVTNAQRQRQKLAVIFADLDGFKLVNDSLGHDWGDELLRNVARRIEGCVRHGDTVARLGGDEFTLILPGIEKIADAEKIATKMLDTLRPPLKLGQHEFFVTASLGVAVYPDHGDSVEALLKNADAAMYRAKEDGRDTFRFFAREMSANVLDRLSVESELRNALVEGQLLAHYQPHPPRGHPRGARPGGARTLEPSLAGPALPRGVPAPRRDERRDRPPRELHALDGPRPAPRVARPRLLPPRGVRERLRPPVPALGPDRRRGRRAQGLAHRSSQALPGDRRGRLHAEAAADLAGPA